MASQLINIVRFTDLVVGVPVSLPHDLDIDGRNLVPDVVIPTLGGFTITADAVDVTVTRTVDAPGDSVDVLVFQWHSELRNFGPFSAFQPPNLIPQPFVLVPGTTTAAGAQDRYSPPEKWNEQNVGANTPATPMSTLVSTNFPTSIKAIRPGSIVGLSTRLTAAATAGTLTITVTINGVPGTLSLVHTSVSNPSGGEATQASGIDTFVAGDLIGIQFSTTGFVPLGDDIEAWLDWEF